MTRVGKPTTIINVNIISKYVLRQICHDEFSFVDKYLFVLYYVYDSHIMCNYNKYLLTMMKYNKLLYLIYEFHIYLSILE